MASPPTGRLCSSTKTGSTWLRCGKRRASASQPWLMWASVCFSTVLSRSPPTIGTCWARPRSYATTGWLPASTPSACNQPEAPARCLPSGSSTAGPLWTCGTSTSAACSPSRPTAGTSMTDRSRPSVCCTPCTGRFARSRRPVACADPRSMTVLWTLGPATVRTAAGSGRTGTPLMAWSRSTSTPTDARTGSNTRRPSTGPAGRVRPFSTRLRWPSCSSKVPTLAPY